MQHQAVELSIDAVDLGIERADAVSQLPQACDERLPLGRVFACGDLFRASIQLGFQRLDLGDERAPPHVERHDLVDRRLMKVLATASLTSSGFSRISRRSSITCTPSIERRTSLRHIKNAPPWRGVSGANLASGDGRLSAARLRPAVDGRSRRDAVSNRAGTSTIAG